MSADDLHLTPAILEKLARRQPLTREETRDLVRHLVAHCPHCQEEAHEIIFSSYPCLVEEDPLQRDIVQALIEDGTLTRMRRVLDVEVYQAPQLLAELMRHPWERRRVLVANSPRFQNRGLLELLLRRSWRAVFNDPQEAQRLAHLAVELAGRLDPDHYGRHLLSDLTARAWAQVANARRVMSDLKGANEALQIAEFHLASGTGDPLERARLLDLKASLRREQRRFDEALKLLDEALAIYQDAGEDHRYGRALVNKAKMLADHGEAEEAVELLQEAIPLIDPRQEPRLLFCAYHNQADSLIDLGRYQEARALLPRTWRLATELGYRLDLLRLRWTEGRIAYGLGKFEQAEQALLEVRKGFLQLAIPYDVAQVSLDLTGVYALQNRTREIRELAEEIFSIFQSLEIDRETMAAVLLFRQAAAQDQVTLSLVQELAQRLKQVKGFWETFLEQPP